MVNLNDLRLFVQAVESGGFAAAARLLGLPKSTVSKRVAELETELGARLIHRTSRAFVLTEAGRDYFDHARGALIEAQAAEDAVRRRLAEPSGLVRITCSVPSAQGVLARRLPDLARAYPRVMVEVHASDRFVDVVQEGFDIAIRNHFAPLPNSGLVQRRLSTEAIIMVAAPSYLAEHGTPATPEELASHRGLLISTKAEAWRLRRTDGREVPIALQPALAADESMVLLEAASAGLGIACLPEGMTQEMVAAGRLAQVLPGWTAGMVTTTLLIPHRRGQLPGVRAVVEFLAADVQ